MRGDVLTFGQIISRIWDIGIVIFTFNFSGILEASITAQFMYTRVHCCEGGSGLPPRFDITDPVLVEALKVEAGSLHLPLHIDAAGHIGACDVPRFPASSPQWSLSDFCTNRAYVQESTQHTLGLTAPLQKTVIFLVLPIGAALSDTFGRRPMLRIYAAASVIGCSLLVVDCHLASFVSGGICFVAVGFVLVGAGAEPKDAIMVSCIADLLGHDEVNKSRAMYFLHACLMFSVFVSTSLNYYFFARFKLTNWELPWILFTVVAGIVLLQCITILRETLPVELRLRFEWRKLNPMASWQQSLGVILRDRIILVSFFIEFIQTFAYSGMAGISMSYLSVIGYSPDQAMLLGILAAASQVMGSLCMVPLIVKLGVFPALALSFVLQFGGNLVNGPATLARPGMAYLAAVLLPFSLSIYKPAQLTMISQRVDEADQGKLMGGFSMADVIAVLCSAPTFSYVLFTTNAAGQRVALPAYVAAGASVLNLCLTLYVAHAAPRTPSAYDLGSKGPPRQDEAARLESEDAGKLELIGSYGATDAATDRRRHGVMGLAESLQP